MNTIMWAIVLILVAVVGIAVVSRRTGSVSGKRRRYVPISI